MKLIIASTRTLKPLASLIGELAYNFGLKPTEIVSGGALGVDTMAEYYAQVNKYALKVFKADWETHGKAAGPIRNREMAEYADALLLIWDGKSHGSRNMRQHMRILNKPVYEVVLVGPSDSLDDE